jgi:polysaccharide export outer membrane protein
MGNFLVRPDGNVGLGFYGEVHLAGLTLPEAKEKIVLHLKKYLSDEALGLEETDPETGKKKHTLDPRDSARVMVDVAVYNSLFVYAAGEVATPGRFPFTGSERVVDVIHLAGGLLPEADRGRIKLIRSYPKASAAQILPVDYDEIMMGTDPRTNYEILPFDRLVVPGDALRPRSSSPARKAQAPAPAKPEEDKDPSQL